MGEQAGWCVDGADASEEDFGVVDVVVEVVAEFECGDGGEAWDAEGVC